MQLLSQFAFCTFSRWPNSSTENLSILLYSHFRDARCYENSTELSSPLGTLFTNASWRRKKRQNGYSGHWDMKNGVWLPGQRVLGPVLLCCACVITLKPWSGKQLISIFGDVYSGGNSDDWLLTDLDTNLTVLPPMHRGFLFIDAPNMRNLLYARHRTTFHGILIPSTTFCSSSLISSKGAFVTCIQPIHVR